MDTIITPDSLHPFFQKDRLKIIHCLAHTDSTNRELRDLCDAGAPAGTVVLAEEQTEGRGRLGRSFVSPTGKGIYLSYLLRPTCAPAQLAELTAWTAAAVNDVLSGTAGVECGIKWVNDIVLNRRKLCGILTEAVLRSDNVNGVVVGIGINVNSVREDFPPELRDTVGSLLTETGKMYSRPALAAAVIHALDKMCLSFPVRKAEYLSSYRSSCITPGADISLLRGDVIRHGHALGIGENFELLVRYEDGTEEAVTSGEVSIRGLYGYV